MSYSVGKMAEELMLDPSDVKEIFEAFFEVGSAATILVKSAKIKPCK